MHILTNRKKGRGYAILYASWIIWNEKWHSCQSHTTRCKILHRFFYWCFKRTPLCTLMKILKCLLLHYLKEDFCIILLMLVLYIIFFKIKISIAESITPDTDNESQHVCHVLCNSEQLKQIILHYRHVSTPVSTYLVAHHPRTCTTLLRTTQPTHTWTAMQTQSYSTHKWHI